MIIMLIAIMVNFWISTERIKDARLSGHRYWLINPRAILAGYRKMNWKRYFWSWTIMILCGAAFLLIFFATAEPI